jgi:kinesin family member 18/19
VVVIEKFGVPNGHLKSQQSSMKEYAYDIAFPDDAGQDEVYAKTVKDIVPTILNGYHATIFAYGATGAGKTHTMMGSERDGLAEFDDLDEEEVSVDGIIPHALTDIFTIIRHRKEEEAMLNLVQGSTFEWKVLISYLEVYNEQIRDLLQPSAKPLALREDPGTEYICGKSPSSSLLTLFAKTCSAWDCACRWTAPRRGSERRSSASALTPVRLHGLCTPVVSYDSP